MAEAECERISEEKDNNSYDGGKEYPRFTAKSCALCQQGKLQSRLKAASACGITSLVYAAKGCCRMLARKTTIVAENCLDSRQKVACVCGGSKYWFTLLVEIIMIQKSSVLLTEQYGVFIVITELSHTWALSRYITVPRPPGNFSLEISQ